MNKNLHRQLRRPAIRQHIRPMDSDSQAQYPLPPTLMPFCCIQYPFQAEYFSVSFWTGSLSFAIDIRLRVVQWLFEKAFDIKLRFENAQVIDLFANTDIADRQIELFCDGDGDPALGGTIKFGKNYARDIRCFHELASLFETILPGDGVYDKQGFVRSTGDFATGHALHLFKLGHQVGFVMKPAGCVNYEHIGVPGLCRLKRIKQYGSRIGPFFLLNDLNTRSARPDLELVAGSGTKRIRSTNENVIAFVFDPLRKFADRCSLADTVNADDHDHVGTNRIVDAALISNAGRLRTFKDLEQFSFHGRFQSVYVLDLSPGNPAANSVDDLQGCRDADVCRDK